ncbi:MAG: hypothetical protein HWQ23_07540 [Nostoc sp. JL33]|nr:hypothetical protein [Nostoc sp. JL33]
MSAGLHGRASDACYCRSIGRCSYYALTPHADLQVVLSSGVRDYQRSSEYVRELNQTRNAD